MRLVGGAQCDPVAAAAAANTLYAQESDGILLRSIGMNFVQPWLFCENSTYPGAYCTKVYSAGHSSFQIVNRFAWDEKLGRINLFFGTPQTGESNKGYLASDVARESVTCSFAKDGWTGGRGLNGCGCNFLCLRQLVRGCFPHCRKPQWCEGAAAESGGRCGCAYRRSELPVMLNASKATMATDVNEVVVDAKAWNAEVPGAIRAFYLRRGKCDAGTACYQDFVRVYREFQAQHGCRPVLLIDERRKEDPFLPHVGPVDAPLPPAASQRGASLLTV